MTRAVVLLLATVAGLGAAVAAPARTLDDFGDATAWRASASDQVSASIDRDGDGSLCLHADFNGVSGYAVMRRELPIDWPTNFDLGLRWKGRGAINDVQLKFVDAGGDNVWWMNRPHLALPGTLQPLTVRPRHLSFAWGPSADKTLRQTRFVEFVIAAGREGGRSTLCVSHLALEPRNADPARWPDPLVQTAPGRLQLDFGLRREFSGLTLRWAQGARRRPYTVSASDDGQAWRTLRRVAGGDGELDALFLPDEQARHLRVDHAPGLPSPTLTLVAPDAWPDRNAVITALARETPRGHVPRAFVGQQNHWTVAGVDGGGPRSALLSEDGALEIGRGGPSVEPSLRLEDGTLVTWADVQIQQSLPAGALPLPRVHWTHGELQLDIDAAADGTRNAPTLLARYRLHNHGRRERRVTLQLALRPWQVNPPQQFLNTPGGVRPVATLAWHDGVLWLDGQPTLRPTVPTRAVQALPFDGGLSLDALARAPRLTRLQDPQALASALLSVELRVPAQGSAGVGWVAPLGPAQDTGPVDPAALESRFAAVAANWQQRLGRVVVDLPAVAGPIAATLRTALAHLLISRDGPALQPGTRAYARSWIRDGAMMVAALLRLGEVDAAREFVDWFAGHVFASGKVPCCVDRRGADPVVENDSHGEFVYAVAEVWRHTRDAAWLRRHWPTLQRVIAWQEALRQSERGDRNREPARAHLFGLLPPSISHEGYSDKPAYAYWDDLWALRGYKDAVLIAQALGQAHEAATWAAWRDEFARELKASVQATARVHGIGFVAGAADRGDFDPTSTSIALSPVQADLPEALLHASFERYAAEAAARAEGRRPWTDYTPYELRNIAALLRLGQPERALALLRFFFGHQRPAGWHQWAEVVLPDPRTPRFLGDMPHAWVSSDFVRSALELLAYEREADATLVLGGGIVPAWREQGDIAVQGLVTGRGPLDYRLLRRPTGWTLQLDRLPARGVLAWPGRGPLPRAVHDGRALPWQGRELPLPPAPARIELSPPMEGTELPR